LSFYLYEIARKWAATGSVGAERHTVSGCGEDTQAASFRLRGTSPPKIGRVFKTAHAKGYGWGSCVARETQN